MNKKEKLAALLSIGMLLIMIIIGLVVINLVIPKINDNLPEPTTSMEIDNNVGGSESISTPIPDDVTENPDNTEDIPGTLPGDNTEDIPGTLPGDNTGTDIETYDPVVVDGDEKNLDKPNDNTEENQDNTDSNTESTENTETAEVEVVDNIIHPSNIKFYELSIAKWMESSQLVLDENKYAVTCNMENITDTNDLLNSTVSKVQSIFGNNSIDSSSMIGNQVKVILRGEVSTRISEETNQKLEITHKNVDIASVEFVNGNKSVNIRLNNSNLSEESKISILDVEIEAYIKAINWQWFRGEKPECRIYEVENSTNKILREIKLYPDINNQSTSNIYWPGINDVNSNFYPIEFIRAIEIIKNESGYTIEMPLNIPNIDYSKDNLSEFYLSFYNDIFKGTGNLEFSNSSLKSSLSYNDISKIKDDILERIHSICELNSGYKLTSYDYPYRYIKYSSLDNSNYEIDNPIYKISLLDVVYSKLNQDYDSLRDITYMIYNNDILVYVITVENKELKYNSIDYMSNTDSSIKDIISAYSEIQTKEDYPVIASIADIGDTSKNTWEHQMEIMENSISFRDSDNKLCMLINIKSEDMYNNLRYSIAILNDLFGNSGYSIEFNPNILDVTVSEAGEQHFAKLINESTNTLLSGEHAPEYIKDIKKFNEGNFEYELYLDTEYSSIVNDGKQDELNQYMSKLYYILYLKSIYDKPNTGLIISIRLINPDGSLVNSNTTFKSWR